MNCHPKTGLRYIVSFPPLPGRNAYQDPARLYASASSRFDWIECVSHDELDGRLVSIAKDPRNFVVEWGVYCPSPPRGCEATFARVFSEALDKDPENMHDNHRKWLEHTTYQIKNEFHGLFAHTPWMAEQFAQFGETHVLPMGWDPNSMGLPDRNAPKIHRYTYNGCMVGKREWVCPSMRSTLGHQYTDATGYWGSDLLKILNRSSAYLYLSHSDVQSFSTFRIWQTIATSAAFVAESGRDCWPMTEDLYVGIPALTPRNVDGAAEYLASVSDAELARLSVDLHDALGHYTIDWVIDNHLVPASEKIVASRLSNAVPKRPNRRPSVSRQKRREKKDRMRICLVMIVKDEAHVMPRCLTALQPHINSWVIVDTGSSDDTIEVIREHMDGIPGELHEIPFESFQKNRTEALELARERGDAEYLLMIDADDTWAVEDGFQWPDPMDAGAYDIKHVLGGITFYRPAVTRADLPWRYVGVAHETVVCHERARKVRLARASIQCGNDGSRRLREPVKKYERVAKLLQDHYDRDPKDSRTVFYLAQSYRDHGELDKALKYYTERVSLGGWAEEVWYSKYQIGKLHELMGHDWSEARSAYLDAFDFRATRAEPLVALSALCRESGEMHMAYIYASAARNIPYPKDILFIEDDAYGWAALDNLAVPAHRIGFSQFAISLNLDILADDNTPDRQITRIANNLAWSCDPVSPQRPGAADRVTVLIPSFGDIPNLKKSVRSMLSQTYENLRIVIVSYGRVDEAAMAIPELNDERVVRIYLENRVNKFLLCDAILMSSEDTFFIVQDDMAISRSNRVEKLVSTMRSMRADVVLHDIQVILENGKTVLQPSSPREIGRRRDDLVEVGTHLGLWRTSSLRAIGGFSGFRSSAGSMAPALMAKLGRAGFLNEPLLFVRDVESEEDALDVKVVADIWDAVRTSDNPIESARNALQNRISMDNSKKIKDLSELFTRHFQVVSS